MKKILRTIGVFLVVCLGVFGFTACGGDEIADNTKYYDKITKTLKLEKSYTDKCFYTDGIGSAKVASYTDGDTTLFRLDKGDEALGDTANIRYYGIDTPESTGSVEKWGKSASNFVKNTLSKATEIVLEATKTPAEKDSYGTRYLGYVWYKTAEDNDFKNLNLEIVENGYSENRGSNTSAYPYDKYFRQAEEFAKSIKLRIFSDLDDPLYSTDPEDCTVEELIANNFSAFYNEEADVGSKVRFTAYLKSLTISGSGTYTFVAEQYDRETGKTYSVNVYTGYNSSPASSMKLGHMYQIVGTVQKRDNSYQIAGPVYNDLYPTDDNTHVTQRNYYWNFDSATNYTNNNSATLYSDVTVKSVSVAGTVMTIVGSAQKANSQGYADAADYTFEVNVEAGYTPTLTTGNTFSVRGVYKFDKNSDVLTVLNVKNIVKK